MSSSRLMDAGRSMAQSGSGILSKSLLFVVVGLVGMIFMCSALFWVGSSITGWFGDVAQIRGENSYSDYGPGEAFPIILNGDNDECTRRRWRVQPIDIGTQIIYECHPR